MEFIILSTKNQNDPLRAVYFKGSAHWSSYTMGYYTTKPELIQIVCFTVFQQNSELIEQKLKALPRGIILGDETYMGSRGNSNA